MSIPYIVGTPLEDFESLSSDTMGMSAHRRLRMTRPLLRKRSAPTWNITTIPATALCLLLFPLGTGAFSVPAPYNSLQYRLVDHVDQLQQLQRSRTASHDSSVGSSSNSDPTTTPAAVKVVVPPPHLFRIPAPGGDVCLVVDEKGAYHAVRDAFPPLGLPVSSTGVVDTQVNVIGDTLFGTRFNLSDGSVRGPWCPGGTAGPLLRIARRLRGPLLLRKTWATFLRRALLVMRGDEDRAKEATRPPAKLTAALEVLPVTENADGSLAVTLPPPPPPCHAAVAAGAGAGAASELSKRTNYIEGDVVAQDSTQKKRHQLSWVADCGLAGYEH